LVKESINLCVDCHEKTQSLIYQNFKILIYEKDLFIYSFKEIKELIYLYFNKNKLVLDKLVIKRILYWIKKRYIIEYFYNSECVSCGKPCDINSLQSFIFHHRTEKKTNIWGAVKKRNIKGIIEWIKEDDCVCLCANCHIILQSKIYLKYVDIIFNDEDLKVKLTKELQKMKLDIKSFKFKN